MRNAGIDGELTVKKPYEKPEKLQLCSLDNISLKFFLISKVKVGILYCNISIVVE